MKNNNSKSDQRQSNEVEKLLEAAHDEMLLKLSVDSHTASISSNYLDADLDRRFQALRSRPSVPPQSKSQSATPSQSQSLSQTRRNVSVDDELKSSLGDDLSARFAALKASSSSSSADDDKKNGVAVGPKILDGDDDDGEDEVEKIIRWAKDAARLDPSPPSDDDDDDDDKDSDRDTDSDSDDDEEQPQRNKGRRKQ